MKKILMIVGSLRSKSFNYQLAKMIESKIINDVKVEYLEYSDIPRMNQDIEFPTPKVVEDIKKKVIEADGIWIITPEYNGSYPAILKDLIDWLSRPITPGRFDLGTILTNKKVTYNSVAGRSKGSGVRDKLHDLLLFVSMDVLNDPNVGIALDAKAFETDVLTLSKEDEVKLERQIKNFMEFIK